MIRQVFFVFLETDILPDVSYIAFDTFTIPEAEFAADRHVDVGAKRIKIEAGCESKHENTGSLERTDMGRSDATEMGAAGKSTASVAAGQSGSSLCVSSGSFCISRN